MDIERMPELEWRQARDDLDDYTSRIIGLQLHNRQFRAGPEAPVCTTATTAATTGPSSRLLAMKLSPIFRGRKNPLKASRFNSSFHDYKTTITPQFKRAGAEWNT